MSHVKKKSGSLLFGAIATLLALPVGCGSTNTPTAEQEASTEDITSTANISTVKRQSIGNCWIYAIFIRYSL